MSIELFMLLAIIGSFIYFHAHKIKVEAALEHAKEIVQRDLSEVESRMHSYVTRVHDKVSAVEDKVENAVKAEVTKL